MEPELWRWQHDQLSELFAATVLPDGSPIVVGFILSRSVVFKLDPHDGSVVWQRRVALNPTGDRSKARFGGYEAITGAVADGNGSIFVAGGYTTDLGGSDLKRAGLKNRTQIDDVLRPKFAVTKLDSDGRLQWRREGGMFIAVGNDGSPVVSGGQTGDGSLMKLDADGRLLWKWELEKLGDDCFFQESAVAITDDEGVVLAGSTLCLSDVKLTLEARFQEFAAIKVDSNGQQVWLWQGGTCGSDTTHYAVAAEGGSVILSGSTSKDPFDKASHQHDVTVAIKLDAEGREVWRWKGSSADWRHAPPLAMDGKGSLLMGGYKESIESVSHKGTFDLVMLKLNASTGRAENWRWQNSTSATGGLRAMAAGPNGTIVLAGYASGSFGRNAEGRTREAVAVLLDSKVPSPRSLDILDSRFPSPKPSAMRTTFDVDSSTSFVLLYAVLGMLAVVAGVAWMAREMSRLRNKMEVEMRELGNRTAVASTEDRPIAVAAPVERAGDIYGVNGPGRRGRNGPLRRFIPIAVAYHNSQVVREHDEASPEAPTVQAYAVALTDSSTPRSEVVRI